MSLLAGRTVVERPDTSGGSLGGLVPLLVIATAQLMLVLDDSIVNIARSSIQRELGVSAVHLPWVVNAYILAFGALLLLLGGRIGDLWGRGRTLQVGITVFIIASLVGGLGQSTALLVVARAVQGTGAALTAPNALALTATTFSDRNRSGAHLTMLLVAVGPMGTFCVITLYLQQVLRVSPLLTGISWLPFAVGIVVGAGLAPKVLVHIGPRHFAVAGALPPCPPPRRTWHCQPAQAWSPDTAPR